MVGHEDPRDPYQSRYDAHNNIPPEAFAPRRVRGTIPNIDMTPPRDTTSQQLLNMASLVTQLASVVPKYHSTPPATAADTDSLSLLTPDAVGRPSVVVADPLPIPPVVPTGKPVHYTSGARPKRQHTVKLDNYTGQGALLEAILDARYEIERDRNDEGQRKIIDLQRQLEGLRSWWEEQTRAQAVYSSGAYYTRRTLHLNIMEQPHWRLRIRQHTRHRTVITTRTMESGKTRKRERSDLAKSHRAHPVSHAVNKGTGEYPALRTLPVKRQVQP